MCKAHDNDQFSPCTNVLGATQARSKSFDQHQASCSRRTSTEPALCAGRHQLRPRRDWARTRLLASGYFAVKRQPRTTSVHPRLSPELASEYIRNWTTAHKPNLGDPTRKTPEEHFSPRAL